MTTNVYTETKPLETARSLSRNVLLPAAAAVDAEGRFPRESIEALRDACLVGLLVPGELGGYGADLETFCSTAAAVGEGCLSTALIWAMHCQQVAVLADHAADEHGETLRKIADEGFLVASVTSEFGKGGHLLTAKAPLLTEESSLRVRRSAPVVSYGEEADLFLVTMRSGEDRPDTDVSLILLTRDDGEIAVEGGWDAMGMRGTRSVPMSFDAVVGRDRLVGGLGGFRRIAVQTMIPVGHLGWTAAWFGAARGAFRRFVRQLRSMGARGASNPRSDLFACRLSRVRMHLDLIEALLKEVTRRLDGLRKSGVPPEAYEDYTLNIAVNNLKVAGSELAFSVANGLVELGGLSKGYLRNDDLGLERVFRDLRSAALMYGNDRLLVANGRLILVEGSRLGATFNANADDRR